MALIEYREALNQAFAEEIERDPNVVIIGEEVAQYDESIQTDPRTLGNDLVTSDSWTLRRLARRLLSGWV